MLRTGWEQALPLPVGRQGYEPVGALRQPSIDASYSKHMKHQLANARMLHAAFTFYFYLISYSPVVLESVLHRRALFLSD